MKKLLIALMSVASFALMAKAETAALTAATGTSFESDDVGEFTPSGDYWATAEEAVGEIATEGVSEIADRPEMFLNETQAKYLKVSTTDGFTRYAQADGSAVEIGSGVYFDSLVQFTAADKARTLAEGDKLAIWLKAGEEETDPATLMVSAGVIDGGAVTQKDYAMTVSPAIAAGSWHRLTVKSISNVLKDSAADPIVGLVVFIDGVVATTTDTTGLAAEGLTPTAADWFEKGALIPSFSSEQTFSEAMIIGEGAVDDLSFTPVAPEFAADKKYFTLNWELGVFEALSINGEPQNVEAGTADFEFTGSGDDNVFTLAYELSDVKPYMVTGVVCSAGVTYVEGTDGGTFTATDASEATICVQAQLFKVGDEYYDDIYEAMAAADGGETVKLMASISAEESLVVGENIEFVLDLAGNSIIIEDESNPAILGGAGSHLTVIDSIGGGEINGNENGAIITEGDLTIGAADGDEGALFNDIVQAESGEFVIVGGKFLADYYDDGGVFVYSDYVATGSKVSDTVVTIGDNDYWVVTPGDAPVVDSYVVSWTGAENARVVATVGGVQIENGNEVEDGKEVVFVVTPEDGYEFAEEEYAGWEFSEKSLTRTELVDGEAVSLEIPEATEIPATTVQISLPAATAGVTGYIVSNVTDGVAIAADVPEEPVIGGETYTLTLGKKVEIWVVPADGYRVTGNPYVINEVTSGTTVDVQDLPSVEAIAYVAEIVDGDKFETLQAAIDAAETDDTVTLLADVSEKITIAAGKQLTLDLNEKTLTGTDANYVINNLGTLVIIGNGVVDSTAVSHNTLIRNGETGVMTIENGTFKSARITVKNDENGKGVYGVLTINGGTFLASSEQGTEVWDSVQNWGVATINGGEFDGYIECRAESNWNAGVMTITGGTFQKPVQTVVVFDSTQTAADNAADVALTIEGGTFNDMVMRVADVKAKAGEAENVRVDFDESMPEYVASCKTLGTVTIPGKVDDELNPAVFANDESVYCEDGYKTKDLGDGKYGVEVIVYVAKIDDVGYETLADAVTAATDGQTITVLDNLELTERVAVEGKDITFDLNAKTVTFTGCSGFYFLGCDGAVTNGTVAMEVPATAGSLFAINFEKGNGLVKDVVVNAGNCKYGVTSSCDDCGDDNFNDATVVCENVDVSGSGMLFYAESQRMTLDADCSATQTGTNAAGAVHSDALAAGWLGELTVNGGTYTAEGNVVATMSSPARIKLVAGTFSGAITITPVSEGYKEMGDHHITKYETIELAAPAGYEWDEPDEDGMQLLIEEVPTYAITWTDPENATVVAIDEEGDAVESGDEYSEGCKIAFTVTPEENYTYAGVELGTAWTLLENGAISNLVTMGAAPVEVTIPEAVAAAPAWDIPGANGGIKALVKEDGVTKYVEFTSVDFSGENPTIGLKAAEIAAQDELFGLICKTDLTKDDTFVINASLSVPDGSDATQGLFTITEADLSVYPQLFVVGVGPAEDEQKSE